MTPSLKRTSYAAVTNTPAERRQVEEQRALPAPEDPRELGPRGPPQVFMPMVPPLPTFPQVPMVGGLQPALPAQVGPGQGGGRDGGGGMPSLLQPVQEQAFGGCSQGWNNPTLECGGLVALQKNCRWRLKDVEKNYLKGFHR